MGCLSNILRNMLKYIIKNLAIFSDVPTNVPKTLHMLVVPVSRTKGVRHRNTELK